MAYQRALQPKLELAMNVFDDDNNFESMKVYSSTATNPLAKSQVGSTKNMMNKNVAGMRDNIEMV